MRLALLILAVTAAGGAAVTPAAAQNEPMVRIELPVSALAMREGPVVRTGPLLSAGRVADLLQSGFPARISYRVELWSRSGWFDTMEGRREWDVVVRYDPLDRHYRVARVDGETVTSLGRYSTLDEAERALGQPYRAQIVPRKAGESHYYIVHVTVRMLSLSDLDEVERWLRGELRPAVRGQRNPGTALTRGVRTLMLRLLGGEQQQYRSRTRVFVPSGV